MPPLEEEPTTKQDKEPTTKHTTVATNDKKPQPESMPEQKHT